MSKIIWLNVIQFSNNAIILFSPKGAQSNSDGCTAHRCKVASTQAAKRRNQRANFKCQSSNVKNNMAQCYTITNYAIILFSPEGAQSISDGRSPSLQVRIFISREAAKSLRGDTRWE